MTMLPAGYRLEELAEVASTMDLLRARAEAGEAAGLVIRAERQLQGRGRRSKIWESPRGNLYCSLLLRPDCALSAAAQVGFIAALAIREAVSRRLPGRCVQVKWPNDVLVEDRKVSGLLLEAAGLSGKDRCETLILGIGLNLVSHPADTAFPATDLSAMGAEGSLDPRSMLCEVLASFATLYALWQREGFASLRLAWLKVAARRSKAIEVRLHDETLNGVFEDLDADGGLSLRLVDGGLRRITAGEVFFPTVQA